MRLLHESDAFAAGEQHTVASVSFILENTHANVPSLLHLIGFALNYSEASDLKRIAFICGQQVNV